MSRIDDLIAELCPDGVEFHELREVFTTRGGYTPPKSDGRAWTDGTVPWFRMEDIRENGRLLSDSTLHIHISAVKGGRLFPANSILVATSATIGDHALVTVPHLANQRFTSLAVKPEFAVSLDARFVFYYCFVLGEWCRRNTTTSSFATVDMEGFRRFQFPVPPLEVQREIVRILDAFAELEVELEVELEARRRQYAHYRDALIESARGDVAWAPLRDLGRFVRGKRFTKADYDPRGIGCIHYGEIYTHYGTSATSVVSRLRPEIAHGLRYAEPGDVVIVDVGETVEDVGKAVAWLGEEPVAIHDHSYAFRHSLNPVFVSYLMQTTWFRRERAKYVARTKVNTLLIEGFARIEIPVPPLEEQARIVGILDSFDALVNDLSVGLPAELAARRKQYEYYRDRLLTFKEAV